MSTSNKMELTEKMGSNYTISNGIMGGKLIMVALFSFKPVSLIFDYNFHPNRNVISASNYGL